VRIRPGSSIKRRRELRENQTDAERVIWNGLRARQLSDWKFRRQHAIGPYILDFYCVGQRLDIELDGSQHLEADQWRHDRIRDRYLADQGIRVLRFSDYDVLTNWTGVLEAISEALTPASPTAVGEGQVAD
jgi:very-short-patch-repair endonuclease